MRSHKGAKSSSSESVIVLNRPRRWIYDFMNEGDGRDKHVWGERGLGEVGAHASFNPSFTRTSLSANRSGGGRAVQQFRGFGFWDNSRILSQPEKRSANALRTLQTCRSINPVFSKRFQLKKRRNLRCRAMKQSSYD